MTAFACMLPSMTALSFIDELVAMAFLGLAVLDIIVNRDGWLKYKALIILLAIMMFYAVYSITAVHYNTTTAVITDVLIEMKPYIAMLVLLGIRPRLTEADKSILRYIAVTNITLCAIILIMPTYIINATLGYIAYGGIYIFVSTLVFIYCSLGPDGALSRPLAWIAVGLCSLGILCGRSKFYAELVFLIFYLCCYRPGMVRNITARQLIPIISLIALVMIVTWDKFSYYFLGGNISNFDPDILASYARPVLFATGALILIDHFPFGTGLASFASAKSAEPYSGVYAEYGIDKVYGLSPTKSDFICDAYYPTIAQFGLFGFCLFIYLWIWIIRQLGKTLQYHPHTWRLSYSIAMLCILFVLIESTGGTAVTTMGGIIALSLLGIITGYAKSESFDAIPDNPTVTSKSTPQS